MLSYSGTAIVGDESSVTFRLSDYVNLTERQAPSWLDWDSATYRAKTMLSKVVLYEDGCLETEDITRRDCSAACQDPVRAWNDTSTLANCMVIPMIAKLFHDGNITTSDFPFMESYGIPQNDSSPLYMKWPAITGCLDEWCKDPSRDGCGHYNESFTLQYYRDVSGNGTGWTLYDFVNLPWPANVCQGINAEINPDIGGIGVFISYLMQLIVVYFWEGWHILGHCRRFINWLTYYCRGRRCSEAWKLANGDRERNKASSVPGSLVDALHDFHKAQCFFVLAIQVACLIALNNPDYLAATSWQQFWNNIGMLFDLAFGGCLLVLFSLLILRRCGRRDTDTLVVSIASIGLAAATWFITWEFNDSALETLQTHIKSDGISECGDISPTQYCWENDWFFSNWISFKSCGVFMSIFVLIMLICMTLDQIRIFPNDTGSRKRRTPSQVFHEWLLGSRWLESYENFVNKRRHVSWLAKVHLDTGPRLIKAIRFFLLLLVEVALMWLLILLLNDYKKLLLPARYVVLDLKAWTLGQVLSVTIWLPLLFEWAWKIIARMYNDSRGRDASDGSTDTSATHEKTSDTLSTKPLGYERINKRPETTLDEIAV